MTCRLKNSRISTAWGQLAHGRFALGIFFSVFVIQEGIVIGAVRSSLTTCTMVALGGPGVYRGLAGRTVLSPFGLSLRAVGQLAWASSFAHGGSF